MNRLSQALGLIPWLMFLPAQLTLAHHSAAQWDLGRRITVAGTVALVQFRNPHGRLQMTVRDAQGKVVVWQVETSALNLLTRRGWKLDKVKVGAAITAIGHPHKRDATALYLREVRLADGTSFGDPAGQDKALD
jgi:hypothetical protein